MKRVIPIILVFSLLLSYAYAETVAFPDLPQDHWAYSAVMALVADGTIKGFEDGEFKPSNTVSRAEFVKMIGKGPLTRDHEYADVTPSHWGYDYIMTSGLDGDDNYFYPDTAITRFDVAQLIWKRAGETKGIVAPALITDQGPNKDAIAWVYAYGIMIGNDGIDLRLNDTLTRAEAASLIVRARAINSASPQINFIDTVQDKLLETVFNSAKLFDNSAYDPNKPITNGEMARAAVRLGSEEYNVSYVNFTAETPFEHKYAKDLYVIGKYCIGQNKVTPEFIDKNASVQDTLAAFTYNAIKKSNEALSYGAKNNYYKEISSVNTDMENVCLTFAYEKGVSLYANGKINPNKEITMKELAVILLQLDHIAGINSSTVLGQKKIERNTPLQTDLYSYPSNAGQYQCILREVPKEVYEAPFINISKNKNKVTGVPKEDFDFAREYGIILTNMLDGYAKTINSGNKVKIQLTYYPSLAVDNGNGYTMRMKCEILDAANAPLLKDVFKIKENVNGNMSLTKGTVFYADFNTGIPVSDISIPSNLVAIDQVISVGQ